MSPFIDVPRTRHAKTKSDEDESEDDIIDHLPVKGSEKHHASTKEISGLLDPDALRRLSFSPLSEGGRLTPAHLGALFPAPRPLTRKAKFMGRLHRFWKKNECVMYVAAAQLFGAMMNMSARLLELDDKPMHPLQVMFVRMSVTTVFSLFLMYWRHVPHAPLGPKGVRWLLVARGLSGFFGIFGMWYSMMYIPLAEATVITFLVPGVSGYLCHIFLHEPFTRKEQIASFLALAGVILIARPVALFTSAAAAGGTAAPPSTPVDVVGNMTKNHDSPHTGENAGPTQRLIAIAVALLGVMGGSVAFTTIRSIGDRAHALISVNYFTAWCMIVSMIALAAGPILDIGQPDLQFGLPNTIRQWVLMLFIMVFGFVAQFLMTMGLGGERSNRATAMTYTHMLFAAGFDKWVFGHEMGWVSLVGCGLIIGSALWVVLGKQQETRGNPGGDIEATAIHPTERVPMLASARGRDTEEPGEAEEAIPLEPVWR